MFYRLILYLGILIIGGLVGYKELAGTKIINKLNHIQSGALLFLLFVMGVRIGLDEKVISSFFKLGFQAIILSIFSIVCSVLLVRFVVKFTLKKERKGEISNES
ncbi:LysO family transporter [Sporosalibacterium faouarense]|uniref:LysO family transporter n=1 Tax=Sporosalibacterium faouarense TaxID=516123 RepID=UPI00141D4196|nr:LysO family transporter [Sporosalibacterium faouarense]MTI48964.1 lysine exporter LysO family protein [Bacillota bacterium]